MSSIVFGSGILTLGGKQVGLVESASVDIKGTVKTLQGGQDFPIASAVTGRNISGKVSFRDLDSALIASLLPNASTGTGALKAVINEAATVSGTVHTATVAHSATFDSDGGVLGADGVGFKKVASAPALGQYSVSAGVYTFNASEAQTVRISYFWTDSTGTYVEVANAAAAASATYNLKLFTTTTSGGSFGIEVYAVTIPSLSIAVSGEDFSKQDLEWSGQQNPSGKVYKLHY